MSSDFFSLPCEVSRVEKALGVGYVDEDRVAAAREAVPDLEGEIMEWLRRFRVQKDWRRVERFVHVASFVHPAGLGEFICEVLEDGGAPVVKEDLVEILGEIQYGPAAAGIADIIRKGIAEDAPYYAMSQKCMTALGDLGTNEADVHLRSFLAPEWPSPIRWFAAVELDVVDEMGFIEEDMLRFP